MVHPLELSGVAGSPGLVAFTFSSHFESPSMNAPLHSQLEVSLQQLAALQHSADAACARIAPTWPLDQFIAVNPYWGWVNKPFTEAAAELARLSGTSMWTQRDQHLVHWKAGDLRAEHLQSALDCTASEAGPGLSVEKLTEALHASSTPPARWKLMTDLVDAQRDLTHHVAWRDFVTHQISQHCAAYFDRHQAVWGAPHAPGLYATWLQQMRSDKSATLLMSGADWSSRVGELPTEPADLMAWAMTKLQLPEGGMTDYFTALLLGINGWASWCAYERWQVKLAGAQAAAPCESTGAVFDADALSNLLAVRLAWECLLLRDAPEESLRAWRASMHGKVNQSTATSNGARADALLQRAAEFAYQAPLCEGLLKARQPLDAAAAKFQAVFCIDVRSEVFRRALESTGASIQTRGFAGFFGLPIAYRPLGCALVRPQLPGLLSAGHEVTEVSDSPSLGEVLARERRRGLDLRSRWREFRTGASSGFSFVEACGCFYGVKLLSQSLPSLADQVAVEQTGLPGSRGASSWRAAMAQEGSTLRPRWNASPTPSEAEVAAQCELAAKVLGAMGWSSATGQARLVLLAGHGSQSANNAHAAGLDCGACGGQTGEVNARVLVGVLNDPKVRSGLAAHGVALTDHTQFVAALHNTTTDEMTLYDLDLLPASHSADVAELTAHLSRAGQLARAERASALGLTAEPEQAALSADQLFRAIKARANDWAEVRPEWALANNAAFIVAPRWRTQHLNLAGRAFLHDYEWQQDSELALLELIMTAPMVVANWINMQYHASTVDNARYGSGNKLLHNVVGGRLGVFEGNGGDLRIGLPWQSVHDGQQFMHAPLRLSVFIEAPQASIDHVIAQHEVVRQLVENEWLHLFQIDPMRPEISQRQQGLWKACA
jgi:uncharacterized protein